MRLISFTLLLVVLSCEKKDNSADTDQASRDLTEAQSALSVESHKVLTTADDVERRKRALLADQQALADQEKALAGSRQQLGSAEQTLVQARATYSSAVTSRLAKLDASLAELATKGDAASKDALAGLRARRELLTNKVAAMPSTTDADWDGYTKDVDTMFDAIERDFRAAK